MKNLHYFHKKSGIQLGKVPMIDKRPLDLYHLHQCVRLRGGFHSVCKKKLWAQIGRELGYSGKIMTSLSTSLKSAYQKFISPYDEFLSVTGVVKYSKTQGVELTNNGVFQEEVEIENNGNSDDEEYDFGEPSQTLFPGETYPMVDDTKSKKNKTTNEKTTDNKCQYPVVTNSHVPLLRYKLNRPFIEPMEASAYEYGESPSYTLRQFQQKAERFYEVYFRTKNFISCWSDVVSEHSIELEYWNVLSDDSTLEVEYGCDIHTSIHGSPFPQIERDIDHPLVFHPWNLNVLPYNKNTCLKYIDTPITSLSQPWLYVGMLFSTQCWNFNDFFSYSLHYHHFGSTRTWYSIPESDFDKFNALIRKITIEKLKKTHKSMKHRFEKIRRRKDSFNTPTKRARKSSDAKIRPKDENNAEEEEGGEEDQTEEEKEDEVFDEKAIFETTVMITPQILKENGIRCYAADQRAGQIIVSFPKSYNSHFNHGFNFVESCKYFPLDDWASNYAFDCQKFYYDHNIRSPFCLERMILTAARIETDPAVIKKIILPKLKEIHSQEMDLRNQIKDRFSTFYRTAYEETDVQDSEYMTTYTSQYSYLSRIVHMYTGDTHSLREFLDSRLKTCHGFKLIIRITSEEFDKLFQRLNDILATAKLDNNEQEEEKKKAEEEVVAKNSASTDKGSTPSSSSSVSSTSTATEATLCFIESNNNKNSTKLDDPEFVNDIRQKIHTYFQNNNPSKPADIKFLREVKLQIEKLQPPLVDDEFAKFLKLSNDYLRTEIELELAKREVQSRRNKTLTKDVEMTDV